MDKILHKIIHLITNNKDKKMIIGISGHGASGKTTFSNKILDFYRERDINVMNADPYIISPDLRKYTSLDYEYKNENHNHKMTACHPDAHNLLALERDIMMIKNGLDFYTIGTDYMESTLISSQNKVTIVEGMSVAFINPNLLDLKIYLYTDGETELTRRRIRDISERGKDINHLNRTHKERRIQYDLFMHPYHHNFDIVIKNSNEGFYTDSCDFTF